MGRDGYGVPTDDEMTEAPYPRVLPPEGTDDDMNVTCDSAALHQFDVTHASLHDEGGDLSDEDFHCSDLRSKRPVATPTSFIPPRPSGPHVRPRVTPALNRASLPQGIGIVSERPRPSMKRTAWPYIAPRKRYFNMSDAKSHQTRDVRQKEQHHERGRDPHVKKGWNSNSSWNSKGDDPLGDPWAYPRRSPNPGWHHPGKYTKAQWAEWEKSEKERLKREGWEMPLPEGRQKSPLVREGHAQPRSPREIERRQGLLVCKRAISVCVCVCGWEGGGGVKQVARARAHGCACVRAVRAQSCDRQIRDPGVRI